MNEFFQCSVCFENYDTKLRIPRLLPCQHSFCSSCLPKLVTLNNNSNSSRYYDYYVFRATKDYIECPICRTKHYTKLDEIPKSRLILNLIELTQGNQSNISELLQSQQQQPSKSKQTSKTDNVELRPIAESITTVTTNSPQPQTTPQRVQQQQQYKSSTPTNMDRQMSTPVLSPRHTGTTTTVRQISVPTTYVTVQSQAVRRSPSRVQFESPRPLANSYQSASTMTLTPQTYSHNQPTSSNQHYYHHCTSPQPSQGNFIRLNSIPSSNSIVNIHQPLQPQPQRNISSAPSPVHTPASPLSSSSSSSRCNRSQSLHYRPQDSTNARLRVLNANKRHNSSSSNSNYNLPEWSIKDYLRGLFVDMDKNKDGYLCFDELQEALRHGQLNSEFNVKTVQLLFEKYDMDKDGEIDFDGFHDLYAYLNNEYCSFLTMDKDCSGTIDADELCESFTKRGYKFKKDFYKYIENTMRETNKNGITFDNYCRLAARFDYLNNLYATTPRYQANHTLEAYLKKTFFFNFW